MNVTATLFGQMLTFLVLIWFVKAVLWQPMLHMMDERKKRIAEGLAAAERGHHEKALGEQRAKEIIQEAREKAAEIINQARSHGGELIEEAKSDARAEGERLKAAARAEMSQEISQAKEGLRREVVALALQGAEQVLMREVNAAEHNKALEKLAVGL